MTCGLERYDTFAHLCFTTQSPRTDFLFLHCVSFTAWRRALSNFFRPPRLLHDWNYDLREVEVKAGWTELFYDLLFVASCIVLSEQLKNGMALLRFLYCFDWTPCF